MHGAGFGDASRTSSNEEEGMMVKRFLQSTGVIAGAVLLALAGCADTQIESESTAATTSNRLVQWGAANPQILGTTTDAGNILDFSGTGLAGGTTGEATLLYGEAYVTDGTTGAVSELTADSLIAFSGIMSGYDPSIEATIDETLDCSTELNGYLDDVIGSDDSERAATFVLRGVFDQIQYVVDKGVSQDADLLTIADLTATMVGVKSGLYVTGDSYVLDDGLIGLGEYPLHLHFITDDREIGGHVRSCSLVSGEIEIALANTFEIQMDFSN